MARGYRDKERSDVRTGIADVIIILDERHSVKVSGESLIDLYFVEDIYSPCISGKLIFTDSNGLYEHGPIVGNELVHITYGVEEKRNLLFKVWRVNKIIPETTTGSTSLVNIEMDLVDMSFDRIMSFRFSKSYASDQKTSAVVNKILTNVVELGNINYNSDIETSETKLSDSLVVPYWTPAEIIVWLARISRSQNRKNGYLFYTNTRNVITTNFKTLGFLLSETNIGDPDPYYIETDEADATNKILEWWVEGIDHTSATEMRNYTVHGYDIDTDTYHTENIEIEDLIGDEITTLGRFATIKDDYTSPYPTKNMFTGASDNQMVKNVGINDLVKRYCLQNLVNGIVSGHEKRFAGMLLTIDWPTTFTDEKERHKLYDGVYLVKSITHKFGGASNIPYTQRLVMIKNGYQSVESLELMKSSSTLLEDYRSAF